MREPLELRPAGRGDRAQFRQGTRERAPSGKQHEGERTGDGERLPGGGNLWRRKPKGVAGTRQGRRGCRRRKASRGRGSLKALRSRVRQARHRSLPASASVEGRRTPREGRMTRAGVSRVGRARAFGSHSEREAKSKRGGCRW